MKPLNKGEGIIGVIVGGLILLIALKIILGFALGYTEHETYRVWLALSVIWAPVLFFKIGRYQ